MRRSTGPCTELLGAPDRTGTDLFFRGPSFGPDRVAWTEHNSVRSRVALHGKNCKKRSTDRTVDRRYWTVDRRYLVLDRGIYADRGIWCWTGPGPGPTSLSFGPDRPPLALDRARTGTDPTESWTGPGPTSKILDRRIYT
uniref:Uncharacterized protein n=1 Tax=Plectus sambesii TaxID=2011161 RepID=A0A914ULX9_9BILA